MKKSNHVLVFFFMITLLMSSIAGVSQSAECPLKVGDYVIYGTTSTATYRNYARTFKITVSNNATYPIKGTFALMNGDKENENYTQTNINLEPYVVKTQWKSGNQGFPIQNTTESHMRLYWENTTEYGSKLQFNVPGGIFADQDRQAVIFEFQHNFTYPNRLDNSTNDTVHSFITYKWDYEFGILLEQIVEIDNLNDSSLDGTITTRLKETSLWAIAVDEIDGYPVLTTAILGMGTVSLIMRYIKRRNKHEE